MSGSVGAGYFEALYAGDPDPWGFATSAYEREKYAASLAALPEGRFGAALEVGCSIGVLTRQLAGRCGRVLAIDGAETALVRAREVCGAGNVVFERRMVPGEWPGGRFDLIVFSEVLYYLDRDDLRATAGLARGALAPEGTVLLVHYLGETGAPLGGEAAAEGFIAASGLAVAGGAAGGDVSDRRAAGGGGAGVIQGFVLLLGCQLAGEAVSHGFGLPVPGPVLGLVLLLVVLRVRRGDGEGAVGGVADGLLRNLSLLFVPAGVGVLQHLELVTRYGVVLAAALIVSTAATLTVTVLVFAGISRTMGLPEEGG